MITRVKAVIPSTIEGTTVNTVIRTSICSESEYVASPFSPIVEDKAGSPRTLASWENATDATKLPASKINKLRMNCFINYQAPLAYRLILGAGSSLATL